MPVLAQRAFEAERQRPLPSETVTDLREPGLLLAGRPERFGGHAVDFDTLMEIAAILGEGCGSTAWCYAVWVNHNWLVGLYDDVAQREFFGSGPDVLASSAFDPMAGQVAPADGGYMLHGRWRFSSGADAASWALLGGVTPAQGPGLFLVPRARYHVVDTWFVSGLAGTGSKDVVIDAPVFVPATHFVSYAAAGAAATPGRQLCDRPSHRIPMYTILPWTLVAPLVGVGQAAIGAFQAQCRERLGRVAGGWDPAARASAPRRVLGRGRLRAPAHARPSRSGDLPGRHGRGVHARGARPVPAGHVLRRPADGECRHAPIEASGGHALFQDVPMQRYFRDVHAGSHQVAITWDGAAQSYGRVQLGAGAARPHALNRRRS